MRKLALPLLSFSGVLAMGLLWTEAQTGPSDTNAHLCDFVRHYFPDVSANCQAADWIVSAAGWAFIASIIAFTVSTVWSIATWKGWKLHVLESRKRQQISIGTLKFAGGNVSIVNNVIRKVINVQMIVDFQNTSDHIIFYKVLMKGNINGKTAESGDMSFSGIVYAQDRLSLSYDWITDVKQHENREGTHPYLIGELACDISYKVHNTKKFTRRSFRKVTYPIWQRVMDGPPGTMNSNPIRIQTSNEIES